MHDSLVGSAEGTAVRVSLLSAGLWWAAFTLIPVSGLWDLRGIASGPGRPARAGVVGGSLRQLGDTFAELRHYPQTLLFLLAYLFFNDGIQTVITSSSLVRRRAAAASSQSQLITTVLLVQFVAFGGALLFGRLAGAVGRLARRSCDQLVACGRSSSSLAFFVPAGAFLPFLALGGADRHRARWQPGPAPLAVQPAGARAAGRRSSSASTRPWSAARAGSARSSSASCTSSPTPTAGPSSP